jgi:hypothetical protein
MPRGVRNTPEPPLSDVPPGPHRLEVRVNDKIVFLQRVHDYKIDQQDDKVIVHGSLRPKPEPKQELHDPEPFAPVEDDAL